jgi:enoyl-[acyl-carrier protein] reductase I
MSLLKNRRGLVVGVANARSIAYGIAQSVKEAGASVALTYQNERMQPSVAQAAKVLGAELVLPCDLTDAASLAAVIDKLETDWGHLDFVVHAVASARREELDGRFIDTSLDGFEMAMNVSVYTFIALARACEPLLRRGTHPSLLTLSYLGATRALPNYNVMGVAKAALESSVRYLAQDMGPHGVRVNALSAGPIRTVSAAGIRGLRQMLAHTKAQSPLRHNVTIEDVGASALFALSHLGRGMTGEIFHVDAGYHCVGGPPLDSLDANP